jgi:hypothetical protein
MIITIYSEIALKVKKVWNTYKDIVRREFQVIILRIHISLDIWIFLNRFLFLAIVAYFITQILKK